MLVGLLRMEDRQNRETFASMTKQQQPNKIVAAAPEIAELITCESTGYTI